MTLFGVDDAFEAVRKASHAFPAHILPAIVRAAEATVYQRENDLPRDAIWDRSSMSVRKIGPALSAETQIFFH
jgi:hypothetical protein